MNPARTALASIATAALVLTTAAQASADSTGSGSKLQFSNLTSPDHQRGREVAFTITTDPSSLKGQSALALQSPAFLEKVKRKASNFEKGKNGLLYTEIAAIIRCDTKPGTYAVDLVGDDGDSPLDSVKLTVSSAWDPGNRDFCQGPQNYSYDQTSETAPDGKGGDETTDDETTDGSADTTSETAATSEGKDDGLGTGAVVGIAGGAALVAASVAAGGTYLVIRRRRRLEGADDSW